LEGGVRGVIEVLFQNFLKAT